MNEREEFWAGKFGDDYNARSPGSVKSNFHFFRRVLADQIWGGQIQSVCELGCGVGSNLAALRSHLPQALLTGVEINERAALAATQHGTIHRASLLAWEAGRTFDLVLAKGILIHIAPDDLIAAYQALHRATARYLLIAEYYNPVPIEVPYRGHAGRLWKRDFAGELLNLYEDLTLINYGFVYHRDELSPQDDITWFLMEKRGGANGERTAAA